MHEQVLDLCLRCPGADRPGYHANTRHWNTVQLDDTIDGTELQEMIEHYELVVSRLPRRERDRVPAR